MSTDVLLYLAAFGGGFLGAAFGALVAFVFTGVALLIGIAALIGTSDPAFIDTIAFGPILGPHVCFAGAAAAAAFAARMGWLETGRDVATPLVKLARPVVLLVGGVFGVFGIVVVQLIRLVPWFGANTDAVAMTIVVSGLTVRLTFGRAGVIGRHAEGLTGLARFRPNDTYNWSRCQESWPVAASLGVGIGLLSASAAVFLIGAYPQASLVILLGFALSATSLAFMAVGIAVPVTHHITLISALAAADFLGVTGSPVAAVLIGAVFGGLAALLAEVFSRLWLIRADTYIDPPSSAIWPMTTVVMGLAAVLA
ncbi:MAG: hypothetical protein LBS56_05535 [Propionibacteriaceae bacterium]|jgi:hypothetical protein|nr:hypothetical protein [Propionibacteriaceae bacterium]